ncbi:MAG: FAD-binding oxidoreductase [Acidobacteriota bacterium]
MSSNSPTSASPLLEPSHRRTARSLPREDRGCGWIETLEAPAPAWVLATAPGTPSEFEAVVIGAGFTGLATARRLAEQRPGWRIALIDAQRAGFGASGRSSGFVVDLAHFIARMEPAASRKFVALSRSGIGELRNLAQEHEIACDWDERGWLHVAAGAVAEKSLPFLASWLDSLDEPYEKLDASGLEAIIGSAFYRAGLRLPGSVLVQPAALLRGLAAALPRAVELYEESPVREIRREGSTFRLAVADGLIFSPLVFVAANGYAPALGVFERRLFPLYTFGSLTRPLSTEEQEVLGGEREWGLLAEDAMGSTVRRTRDQRILIRNSARFTRNHVLPDGPPEAILNLHRQAFAKRFPKLAHVPFAHSWGGPLGVTPDRSIAFGAVEPGLFAAGGYTGAGIAIGTTVGRLLADLALGEASEMLAAMQSLPQPKKLPPQPFLDWGIRWQVRRMNGSAGVTL